MAEECATRTKRGQIGQGDQGKTPMLFRQLVPKERGWLVPTWEKGQNRGEQKPLQLEPYGSVTLPAQIVTIPWSAVSFRVVKGASSQAPIGSRPPARAGFLLNLSTRSQSVAAALPRVIHATARSLDVEVASAIHRRRSCSPSKKRQRVISATLASPVKYWAISLLK